MRVLGSYALIYLTAGEGCFQVRGQPPLRCRAGDLLVIFPEIAHAYGPEKGGRWSEIYMVFEGAVFDLWRRLGLLNPERSILRLLPVNRHAACFRKIAAMRVGEDPVRQLARICELQSFLARALAANRESGEVPGDGTWPEWVAETVEQMEADRAAPLETVARKAGLSYESFRKKFRSVTGVSPARYRNRMVIDRARKLIYEERLSNKELADRLGFCDEFHFSRRFREISGRTPGEFRRFLPKTT
jgi:AraC-like DNA-binding protein